MSQSDSLTRHVMAVFNRLISSLLMPDQLSGFVGHLNGMKPVNG